MIKLVLSSALVLASVLIPLVAPIWAVHVIEFIFITTFVAAGVLVPFVAPARMILRIKFVSFTAFVVASVVVPFAVPVCMWVAFLACAVTSTLNSSRMRSMAFVGASKNTLAVYTVEHLVCTAISLFQVACVAVLLK